MNRTIWLAIAFMALGMMLIPMGDGIAKHLSYTTEYSAAFIAWARFVLGACVMLPFALRKVTPGKLPKEFYSKQGIRGVLVALTVVCIIRAVSLSPIAEVFGAFFIGPVLSVILSVYMLGEKASVTEWFSVVLGFVGVLLVVQPDLSWLIRSNELTRAEYSQTAGLYWALLAGIFYGFFLVATRWAAGVGPPLAQVSVQFLVAAVVLTPFAIGNLIQHGLVSVYWLLLMGTTSVLANYFSILALARAKAAVLAPVVYMQVVAATVLGLLLFNETLDSTAALGLAIILLSGFLRIRFRIPGRH